MKVDLHAGRDGSAPVQRVEVVAVEPPRLGHGRRRDQGARGQTQPNLFSTSA